MRTASDFFFSKTTWTSVVAIIGALVAAYQRQITWPEAAATIFAALQVAFVRDSLVKSAREAGTVAGRGALPADGPSDERRN